MSVLYPIKLLLRRHFIASNPQSNAGATTDFIALYFRGFATEINLRRIVFYDLVLLLNKFLGYDLSALKHLQSTPPHPSPPPPASPPPPLLSVHLFASTT